MTSDINLSFIPKRVEDLQWRNQGTSMIAVRDKLRERAPGLLAEMTVLD